MTKQIVILFRGAASEKTLFEEDGSSRSVNMTPCVYGEIDGQFSEVGAGLFIGEQLIFGWSDTAATGRGSITEAWRAVQILQDLKEVDWYTPCVASNFAASVVRPGASNFYFEFSNRVQDYPALLSAGAKHFEAFPEISVFTKLLEAAERNGVKIAETFPPRMLMVAKEHRKHEIKANL